MTDVSDDEGATVDHAPARLPSISTRWGNTVVEDIVRGHSCRVYRPRPTSVTELLLEMRRWSENVCLIHDGRRLTYAEHQTAVAAEVARLTKAGVRGGDRVLLLASNSIEMVTSWWAIIASGGIAVLGNAWWSADEVRHAVELVKPRAVIADQRRRELLGWHDNVIAIEDRLVPTDGTDVGVTRPAVDEDDPAVILFTSGTTGRAKGAILSHRSIVANMHNVLLASGQLPDQIDPRGPRPVNLLMYPLFHISGLQTLLLSALTGGKLVLRSGRFDPTQIFDLIESERVTHLSGVPTMLSRMLDHPRFSATDLSTVRSVSTGGMPVSSALLDRIRLAFPQVRRGLGQVYGLSESGGVLTMAGGSDTEKYPTAAGRPLPVVELRINHPDDGGVGEILARSPTNMSGYWSMPDDATVDDEGWLHTGDLGRVDEGGLHVVGRAKEVIIRAGENVAAPHVEQCLLEHPDIAEVAVVALPHPDLGEEVAAILVPTPTGTIEIGEVEYFARQRLALFEVPTAWRVSDTPLPTTPSGKVAKAALVAEWHTRETR
jgi:long-chain acyl-CoA synthetase